MTGPAENSELCFPETINASNSEVEGDKTHCLKGLGHAIVGHALGHAMFGNFSTGHRIN